MHKSILKQCFIIESLPCLLSSKSVALAFWHLQELKEEKCIRLCDSFRVSGRLIGWIGRRCIPDDVGIQRLEVQNGLPILARSFDSSLPNKSKWYFCLCSGRLTLKNRSTLDISQLSSQGSRPRGELLDVIAASAGVRSYYRAMGLPMPQLPQPVEDETLGDSDEVPGFRQGVMTEICLVMYCTHVHTLIIDI